MIVRHTIEAVLNPYFIVLLIFAICLISLYRSRQVRTVAHCLCLIFVVLLLISTGWLPHFLTWELEKKYPPITHPDPSIQWIVVLSGGQAEVKGIPEQDLLYSASIKRLLEGYVLWREIPAATLLLSGGGIGFEKAESLRMAEIAAWLPITKQQLQIETVSLNTLGQAKAIKNYVGTAPFYLVTSAIHMPRAMMLCRAQGLNPIAAPADFTVYWNDERWQKTVIPNAHNMVYLDIALHELMGMLWAKMTQ